MLSVIQLLSNRTSIARKLLLLMFCGFMLLPTGQSLATEPTKNAKVKINHTFSPPLGIYTYKVKWGVISAGRATVTFSREGEYYRVIADARAVGGVDKIYKLRYRGESEIDAEDLTPVRTVLTSREGKRSKENVIDYQEDGQLTTTVTSSKKGKKSNTNSQKLQFEAQVFDPFSAIFLARQVEWHEGFAQEFEIFTGSSHYLVELNAAGKKMISAAGALQEAWVIVPTIENLSQPEKGSKVDSAVIYLSADERKELLKIESKVFIGKIVVTLDSFQPEAPEEKKT